MSSEKDEELWDVLQKIDDEGDRNIIIGYIEDLKKEVIAQAQQEAYGKVFDKLDNVTALITKGYFNETIKIRFKNLKEYNEIKEKLKAKQPMGKSKPFNLGWDLEMRTTKHHKTKRGD